METTIKTIFIYIALISMPPPAPPITFGLPPCSGTTTGLTERYEWATETLYVDECLDGIPFEKNLPVIDMTTSVVVIMTSRGRVTVQLPQLRSISVQPNSATLQGREAESLFNQPPAN